MNDLHLWIHLGDWKSSVTFNEVLRDEGAEWEGVISKKFGGRCNGQIS
jgi:hypothetical protein